MNIRTKQAWFWDETSSTSKGEGAEPIDADATLKLFQERFNSGFVFISPCADL